VRSLPFGSGADRIACARPYSWSMAARIQSDRDSAVMETSQSRRRICSSVSLTPTRFLKTRGVVFAIMTLYGKAQILSNKSPP